MIAGPLTPRRVEILIWVALFIALTTGIGFESDWGRRWILPLEQTDPQPASFTQPSLTEPFSLPVAETFMEIALRPIFVITRRPSPTATVEAQKPRMKKDQFTLTGTTLVPEGKFAHLIEKSGNKSHVVMEGKEINGILLKEVRADRVILVQHDETEVVVLFAWKAPLKPTSPILSPAPPQAGTTTSPTGTPDQPASRAGRPATLPVPANAPPPR